MEGYSPRLPPQEGPAVSLTGFLSALWLCCYWMCVRTMSWFVCRGLCVTQVRFLYFPYIFFFAQCFWDLAMVMHVAVVYSLPSLYSVQLTEYTTVYLWYLLLIGITRCCWYFAIMANAALSFSICLLVHMCKTPLGLRFSVWSLDQ